MYVARILYPVRVLGPGERIGIWFCGCTHHCEGCSNPELWEQDPRYLTSVQTVMKLVQCITENHPVDGFTITGGDPFEQAEELMELLSYLTDISDDILVYTGYDFEAILERYPETLKYISVLIDGKYIESRNSGMLLRGSDNQHIIFLSEKYRESYSSYLAEQSSEIQNFTTHDGFVSVGIHRPGYKSSLDAKLKQKGLILNE